MATITPAILAASPELYQQQVDKVADFAERLHIDITDGEFAPSQTIDPSQLWWPDGMTAEIHAMVRRPEEYLARLIPLRPAMIIFHAEAEGNVPAVLATLKRYDIKAGLALQRGTVPSTVAASLAQADHVLIFSGELGRYGGRARLIQLEKIPLIKDIAPKVQIGWDGGASLGNVRALAEAGVDSIAVGGALQYATNPAAAYQQLSERANEAGVL